MARHRSRAPVTAQRVLRCLERSGRVLRKTASGWGVYCSGDRRRRPLLRPGEAQIAELIASGQIIKDGHGGYRLANAPPEQRASPPLTPQCVSRARFRRGRSGFAGLVTQALQGTGPLTLAQARAGLRLQADMELASAGTMASQNWSLAASVSGGKLRDQGGLPPRGQTALMRMMALIQWVPSEQLELACAACGQALSLRALESRFGLRRQTSNAALAEALEQVRHAYDQKIASGDTADMLL